MAKQQYLLLIKTDIYIHIYIFMPVKVTVGMLNETYRLMYMHIDVLNLKTL